MSLAELNSKIARNTEKINLLDNGAFTRFAREISFIENSASEIEGTVHGLDTTLYRADTYSWNIQSETSSILGSWRISGKACSITVCPKQGNSILPSFDGGCLLQLTFRETGDVVFEQTIPDPFRFWDAIITAAISGRQFEGKSTIVVQLILDGEPVTLMQANAVTFGAYRRFYKVQQITTKPKAAIFRITLSGAQGESVAISGATLVLGSSERQPYVTSLGDRMWPSGTVIMYEGETCPQGFVDISVDPKMALISGTNFQSVGGEMTQTIGSDTHDHTFKANPLAETSSATIMTPVPMEAGDVRLVHGIPFHAYPPQIPYTPYKGERPLSVLSNLHSHMISTNMTGIPPTFPLRMCKRL